MADKSRIATSVPIARPGIGGFSREPVVSAQIRPGPQRQADDSLSSVSASRFIVDVEVELPTTGTDLVRNARVHERLADALPRGTHIMADVGQGLAHLRVWIPATSEGVLGALHAVALAMNVALQPERAAVESLGWRPPPEPGPEAKPVVMRLSIVGDRP